MLNPGRRLCLARDASNAGATIVVLVSTADEIESSHCQIDA
jgi:hypothetical protein